MDDNKAVWTISKGDINTETHERLFECVCVFFIIVFVMICRYVRNKWI